MSNDFTQAQETPWRYGFLNLMRRVDVQLCRVPAGNAWQPRMEKLPPGTNARADLCATGNRQCELAGNAAHQPVQPRAVGAERSVAAALHRTGAQPDRKPTRSDADPFPDLFHHRWLTQFPQAWRSAQSAGGSLDKPQHDRFAFYVASLSGQDLRESADSPLPDHVRLAASAHLVRESRNPDGLAATLAHCRRAFPDTGLSALDSRGGRSPGWGCQPPHPLLATARSSARPCRICSISSGWSSAR